MSTPWVYKAVERGSLPFLRLGEANRFDPKKSRNTWLRERLWKKYKAKDSMDEIKKIEKEAPDVLLFFDN